MAIFFGTYTNKVDRKGRVSVPARFRAAIGAQSFQGIVAAPDYEFNAIDACDLDRINEVIDRLDTPGAYTAEQRQAAELVLGKTEELGFDSEGRVLLPDWLMDLAEIKEQATFVGVGRSFQIWHPARRDAFEAETLQAAGGRPLSLKDLPNLGRAQ